MIIAIANQHPHPGSSIIARTLAVQRARSGRKVCVVDTDSRRPAARWCVERSAAGLRPTVAGRFSGRWDVCAELRRLSLQFNDILVDAGHRDSTASRDALAAARLVLAPVRADDLDLASQYALIGRLNAARTVNPALRVKLVLVCDAEPEAEARLAVQAYAARLPAASLAPSILTLPPDLEYGAGRCVCDAELCDPAQASQMAALYREVFLPSTAGGADRQCAAPALPAVARFLSYLK